MKIEDSAGLEAAREAQKVQKTGPAFHLFQAYGAQAPQGNDSAQVSAQAQEISHFAEKLKALPDVRAEKVQALQSQVEAGHYQVPVADLAEAMFRLNELDQA